MSELVKHVVLRSDLMAHVIWDDPAAQARHHQARREGRPPSDWPSEVNSHVAAVHGHDEPGAGVTIHRAAPWSCGCGVDLALDYRDVPAAWAQHAARLTGLPAALLEEHMLAAVAGSRPVARCSCEAQFPAPAEDPLNGDAAVERWAEHVAGLR